MEKIIELLNLIYNQIRLDSVLELCPDLSDIDSQTCEHIGTGNCPYEAYCMNDYQIKKLLQELNQ